MEYVIIIAFLCLVVALTVLSIKYRKIGGIIGTAGLSGLAVSGVCWGFNAVMADLHGIWFPTSSDTLTTAVTVRQDYLAKAEAAEPWIAVSAAVLVLGVIVLVIEIICQHRKRAKEAQ